MTLKITFLLLGALLLVKNSSSEPHDSDASASSTSSEKHENMFPMEGSQIVMHMRMISITMKELTELQKLIIEKGKIVFEKVLDDPQIISLKGDDMEANLEIIRKYVAKLEIDPNTVKDKNVEYIEEFMDILKKFKEENNGNTLEEEKIIQKSLNENGWIDFRKIFLEHFKEFVEHFSEELDEYVKKFNAQERKSEEQLIIWLEKVKAEKDVEKQLELFKVIFEQVKTVNNSFLLRYVIHLFGY